MKESPRKLYVDENGRSLIIAEDSGNLEVLDMRTWLISESFVLFTEFDIIDISRLKSYDNHYILALSTMKGGIRDGKVQIIEMTNNFLSETNSYFEGKSILCV